MLRRIATILLSFVFGVLLVVIAVLNRQPVSINLAQDVATPALPFYLYLFAALIIGVILGGMATWFGQSRWRKTARAQGRRAARWQAEADRLARAKQLPPPASTSHELAVTHN